MRRRRGRGSAIVTRVSASTAPTHRITPSVALVASPVSPRQPRREENSTQEMAVGQGGHLGHEDTVGMGGPETEGMGGHGGPGDTEGGSKSPWGHWGTEGALET